MSELDNVLKEPGTKLEIMYDLNTESFYGLVRDDSGDVLFDMDGCNSIKEVIVGLREIAEYPTGRGDQE